MKERFLKDLQAEGYQTHGCTRGPESCCYYIASSTEAEDYGERQGRVFFAFREARSGELEMVGHLAFFVTKTAMATSRRQLMGDFAEFIVKTGVAKLRNLIVEGWPDGFEEKVLLTTNSPDEEFRSTQGRDPITEQKELRGEILRALAVLHSDGHKRVSRDRLLEHLCAEPAWINRQLGLLTEKRLVNGASRGDMKLTPAGHLEAEKTIEHDPDPVRRKSAPREFDLFISYASEDRGMVQALVEELEGREIDGRPVRIWWDMDQVKLGQRLTLRIEEGLARSRHGVVVISKSSINKPWPEAELRALANRAISTGEPVVLPVLVGLTHEQLSEAFPLLRDIVSTQFEGDVSALAAEIVDAIE